MLKLTAFLLLTVILTGVAEARMYQWTSPASGKVQLAGAPPSWYRALQTGPRVLVFENGELVDDTAVAVSEARRIDLREAAFGAAAADTEDPPEVIAATRMQALKDAMGKAREEGIDIDDVADEFAREQAEAEAQAAADEPGSADGAEDIAARVAALKSLIERWDRQQLDQARSLLELLPDEPVPASGAR